MPALWLVLLVLACESRKLDSRIDLRNEDAVPLPTPTNSIDTECKTSCAACDAWQWGDWLPAMDTVCTGQDFTQKRGATRNCKGLCAGTECLPTNSEERERQGTKTCTDPPPTCKISCVEACGSWDDANWTELSPKPADKCKGQPFTQKQQGTRTCSGLCADVECDTSKPQEKDAVGIKETPCSTHCTITWEDWLPATDTVCKGVNFQQKQKGKSTCKDLCPGTNCPQPEDNTQSATGTKETSCDVGCTWSTTWQVVAGEKQASEVCSGQKFKQKQEKTRTCTDPCVDKTCQMRQEQQVDVDGTKDCSVTTTSDETDTEKTNEEKTNEEKTNEEKTNEEKTNEEEETAEASAEETCATACQLWDPWGDWSSPPSSCNLSAFTSSGNYSQQRSRSRTCDTTNLSAGEKCPTTNNEQLEVPCPYCQGDGQALAKDGTCDCVGQQGYYKESDTATSCTKCEAPQIMKQENSVWTCTEPDCDCDDKSICSEWSEWQVQTDAKEVGEVCKNEEFSQALEQTRTCTAADCVGIDKCKQRDTKTITAVGTKETPCKTTCKGWSDWGDWTPATAPDDCVNEFTQTRSRTRDCAQACAYANCKEKEEETQQVACPAVPKIASGQVVAPAPPCDCAKDCSQNWNWTLVSGEPTAAEICKGLEFDQKQTGTRNCPVNCPEDCKTDTQTKKLIGTKETPCADNCNKWEDWSTWSPTVSSTCPANTSFEPHVFEQTRSRERQCQGICSYIKCPTSNSEIIQTSCPYCQGEGQKKLTQPDIEGRTCICDGDDNYYREDGKDSCTKCEPPNNLAYDSDDGQWECRAAATITTAVPPPNNCPQKYYHSTMQGKDGKCLCDYSRNYIPNRGRFGAANEGQLLGGCVCDNNHEEIEVTENGQQIKKCEECGRKTDLRQINATDNEWECVTCTLQDLLRDSKLAHKNYIGKGKIGFECHCAKFGGKKDKHVYHKSSVVAVALHPPSNEPTLSEEVYMSLKFREWYSALVEWRESDQRPGDILRKDPPSSDGYYAEFGTYESKMWHYSLWFWYLDAYRIAKLRNDKRLYPPIPADWQDHYSTVRAATTGSYGSPAKLRKHSDLRYISCTLMGLIEQ